MLGIREEERNSRLEKSEQPTGSIERNTSTAREVPGEIKGFNFGAFSLSIFWAPAHRLWLFFAVLLATLVIPFASPLGFALSVYLAFKGNEHAWKARRFESVGQFKETQRFWTVCGALIVILSIIVTVVGGAFVIPRLQENASHTAGKPGGGRIDNLQDLIEHYYTPEATWPQERNDQEIKNRLLFEADPTKGRATQPQRVPGDSPTVSGHRTGVGTHGF